MRPSALVHPATQAKPSTAAGRATAELRVRVSGWSRHTMRVQAPLGTPPSHPTGAQRWPADGNPEPHRQ